MRAVRQERPTINAKGVHIGLSAVEPGTGKVIAMYGGETAGNLNEATQARIQPGSAFKAFALSAALEDGISLKSRFHGSSPFKVPGTNAEVNNEFNQSYGANRRPHPGDRGLHQHGVRRPGRADGTAEGRRCGDRGRHSARTRLD